jgi:GR25 family glycosyltransferase involved in LPS biosynthesis
VRTNEGFHNNENTFDVYVISLRREDRLKNIKKQQMKMNQEIIIFDAVKGDKLDVNELIATGVVSPTASFLNNPHYKREIGCYLSHYYIYKKIKQNNSLGYTIIFEDDFDIRTDNLLRDINEAIRKLQDKNVDFELLMLGNLRENHGVQIIDNLYYVDNSEHLWGTHGYVVNNKHIDKILDLTKHIDCAIDNKLEAYSKSNVLTMPLFYPSLVYQLAETSNIRDMSVETFSTM